VAGAPLDAGASLGTVLTTKIAAATFGTSRVKAVV
jgi:hypothetical protein